MYVCTSVAEPRHVLAAPSNNFYAAQEGPVPEGPAPACPAVRFKAKVHRIAHP
jgi:hypothetical protein